MEDKTSIPKFKKILIEHYQNLKINHLDKKKERNSLKGSFITLHLSEESKGLEESESISKREIELEKIWEEFEKDSKRRVLIKGKAGMGKSILSEKLCQQWAQEEIWKDQDYELLILVSLKEMISLQSQDFFEYSIQKYFDQKTCEKLYMEMQELNNSKKILWMVDGLDELEMILSNQKKKQFGSKTERITE